MRGYKHEGILAFTFGLGLVISFLLPTSLLLTVTSIMVLALAITLIKC